MKLKDIFLSKRNRTIKTIKLYKFIKGKKNNPTDGETPEQIGGYNTVTNGRF